MHIPAPVLTETIGPADSGIVVTRRAISTRVLMDVRREIIQAILAADGVATEVGIDDDAVTDFKRAGLALMRDLLARKPHLRRVLPAYFRNLPGVRRLASEPAILHTLKAQGMVSPIERSVSLQLWLPWEKMFHEKLHQDTGGLISEDSWTIQVPLHDVTRETGAVEVFSGTHKLGVLPLELIQDRENGYYYETAGEAQVEGMAPVVTNVALGDALFFRCLNLHRTSSFQECIRWIVVIRYDDLWRSRMLADGTNPYRSVIRSYDFKTWTDQLEAFLSGYKVEE